MLSADISTVCALVLGGHVNGYSVIRELHECGVPNIWLLDYGKSLSRWSNRLSGFGCMGKSAASLRAKLEELHDRFDRLVIFPTDDLQLELLMEIHNEINSFCYLPFNPDNLLSSLDKNVQYQYCEKLGIPYPKSRILQHADNYAGLLELKFPIIIKPSKRDDLTIAVFRNIFVESEEDLHNNRDMLFAYIDQGIGFLASEFVPGDDTQIYAYTGYRSKGGKILNEWIGKKLTQFPDRFGVFSSASNESPEVVRSQGRALLDGMNLMGIAEPEFKYDKRDKKYKLMEINLRSMMWHRTGNRSGVNIQYTQWLDALNLPENKQNQRVLPRIHFVYMKHELINLFSRKGYWTHFKHNVFGGEKTYFGVYDRNDPKPFFNDLLQFPRILLWRWLKILFKH